MLKGVAHYERTHQLWTAFHDDQARVETDPAWLRSRHWDGVISRHTTENLVRACASLKIPLVDLNDMPPFPGVPKVRPDNIAIGHLAAEHLLERGFDNFGYTGFSNDGWSCERRDGFVEALRLAGKRCDVYDVNYAGDSVPGWASEQISGLSAWIQRLPKPAGVLACFDLRAQQILVAAHENNILVPEELAVLGVNNDPVCCELAFPPLSSVAPNAFLAGYRGAEVLASLIEGEPPESLDQRIEPIGVVTRPSTDVLAIDDRVLASALSFIRLNGCQGITVEQVMQHAHASRSQLEKKFRRHLGRSPQAEIRRVQFDKIKQLLVETDFPLKRIAELTGFDHMEYMCVVFKRLAGESPSTFRRRNPPVRGHVGALRR